MLRRVVIEDWLDLVANCRDSVREDRLEILRLLFAAGASGSGQSYLELTYAQDPHEWIYLLPILKLLVEAHCARPQFALRELNTWWYVDEAKDRLLQGDRADDKHMDQSDRDADVAVLEAVQLLEGAVAAEGQVPRKVALRRAAFELAADACVEVQDNLRQTKPWWEPRTNPSDAEVRTALALEVSQAPLDFADTPDLGLLLRVNEATSAS